MDGGRRRLRGTIEMARGLFRKTCAQMSMQNAGACVLEPTPGQRRRPGTIARGKREGPRVLQESVALAQHS
jgi:hypothetical protein